VNKFIQEK